MPGHLGLPAPPPAPALMPISGQGTEGESPAAKPGPGQLGGSQGSATPSWSSGLGSTWGLMLPSPAAPCKVTPPALLLVSTTRTACLGTARQGL